MYYFIPSWSGSEKRVWHRDIIPWYRSMQRLEFDDTIGTYRIINNPDFKDTIVFFSGMLTGQRALDNGSFERLKWHLNKVKSLK